VGVRSVLLMLGDRSLALSTAHLKLKSPWYKQLLLTSGTVRLDSLVHASVTICVPRGYDSVALLHLQLLHVK
jgi:hypothetical protein